MKNILVLHTGGTISMEENKEIGAVMPSQENPLVKNMPTLSDDINITTVELYHLPSPHITLKEMLTIKTYIHEQITRHHYDGVVITHGTDTLEETAYFLDLTHEHRVPIVMTGAMRSSNEIGADGLYNLISAIRVAASNESYDKGVLVVLNDEIHSAKNVTKTHTSNIATFQSPQYGPVGMVTKQKVFYHHLPARLERFTVSTISKSVLLLKAYAGMDEQIFYAIRDMEHVNGIVIEALGQGNLPPNAVNGLKKLLAKNIPVVVVSRCFNGIVQDVYAYEGGGKELKSLGVIFSNGLNGQKARIKLLVALEETNSLEQLQLIFDR